jgi:hypothetical protein
MSSMSQCSLARIERILGGYYSHLRVAPVTVKPPHSACKADALPTELSARKHLINLEASQVWGEATESSKESQLSAWRGPVLVNTVLISRPPAALILLFVTILAREQVTWDHASGLCMAHGEVKYSLDRFFESRQSYPLFPRVKEHTPRKDIRGRIAHGTQSTTISPPANRLSAYG